MLLSRFWYLVLAAAAGASLAMAMLSTGMFNREFIERVDEGLVRDRMQVESLLKIDARARLDAIAPIAADGDIREGLRAAARGKSADSAQKRLRSLNKQLAGLKADLLIAVDENGKIAMQVGRKQPKEGAGLGEVPVVAAALSGYLADDTWVYNGGVYRVAARPVVDSGRYAGAIIHAQRFDAQLSQVLSERLGGVTVGFFLGDRMIASYAPTDVAGALSQDDLGSALASALQDEKLVEGERSAPQDLDGRGRAVYSFVAGSASDAHVGYAIGRPYETLVSPFAVLERTTADDVQALPLVPLAAVVLVAFGVGLGLVFVERDRLLAQFRTSLAAIAEGQSEEMDIGAQRGAFRRLAEGVNAALDKSIELRGGKGKKQKADLNELLGPAEAATSSAFSFGEAEESGALAAPEPHAMPAPKAQAMPAPKPAMPAPPKAPPPPPAPAQPATAPRKSTRHEAVTKVANVHDDAETVVTEVDDDLRASASTEESHFREVFAEYLTMRRQCGESVDGLSFEKFVGTLRKNREQILSKHEAKAVRFTVYEKSGKAALKATPVRA